MKPAKRYDVAISFAGEDREYADALATALKRRSVVVFYDQYEKATLWGTNLYTHLSDLYQNQARYCVMLLSQHYAKKLWTRHELQAAQARAFQEHEAYILPVRLDDTEIPGILPTTGYLAWPPENEDTIADSILTKLGKASQVEGKHPSQDRPSQTPRPSTVESTRGALAIWREKLSFLQEQDAVTADANQKFALHKQIEEARAKIQELGG